MIMPQVLKRYDLNHLDPFYSIKRLSRYFSPHQIGGSTGISSPGAAPLPTFKVGIKKRKNLLQPDQRSKGFQCLFLWCWNFPILYFASFPKVKFSVICCDNVDGSGTKNHSGWVTWFYHQKKKTAGKCPNVPLKLSRGYKYWNAGVAAFLASSNTNSSQIESSALVQLLWTWYDPVSQLYKCQYCSVRSL